MAQQSIPASPKYKYTKYTQLRGIDLTTDVTQVPYNRAADLLNIVPDEATANPRKRVGWRKLYNFSETATFLGSRHLVDWGIDLIVTDEAVYYHESDEDEWTNVTVHTLIANTEEVDAGVGFIGFDTNRDYRLNVYQRRYILTNSGGTVSASEITDNYIPNTIISRNPDGTDGYAYEAVNAFTPERMLSFLGDDSSTDFYFYPAEDRDNHIIAGIESVEIRNSSTGEWEETSSYTEILSGDTITAYSVQDKSDTDTYSVVLGFTLTAPAEPVVVGQDNVRAKVVEFSPDEDESSIYYGYWNPIVDGILKNNVCARFGMANMDREFFAAGNSRIYYTEADNYDYLPDNNFLSIEVDTPIVGFHRKNSYLVAVTQSSAEYTVFMISGRVGAVTHSVLNEAGQRESSTEEMTYFAARTAMAGTGALSARSFATLVDDALFLSRKGIYGITSNSTTTETVVANRSELINPRLTEEANLENAVATIWNGLYVLAVNNHAYLLDSRVTHKNLGVSYGYECYYWENVPVTDFLSYQGNLFFGDHEGNWCRFNTDINNYTAFEDDGTMNQSGYLENGDPIHAKYALRLDSDGAPQYFKTLNKRGTVIELMQLPRSEVKISYVKDGDEPIVINLIRLADKFTWTLVDFEDFTFSGVSDVKTFYPKKKVKKYKYLQFILESDTIDSNFGICGLTKTYYIGNFAKG